MIGVSLPIASGGEQSDELPPRVTQRTKDPSRGAVVHDFGLASQP